MAVSGTLRRPLPEPAMDYEIQRCTRHCHETGRELAAGETYFSVLLAEGAER